MDWNWELIYVNWMRDLSKYGIKLKPKKSWISDAYKSWKQYEVCFYDEETKRTVSWTSGMEGINSTALHLLINQHSPELTVATYIVATLRNIYDRRNHCPDAFRGEIYRKSKQIKMIIRDRFGYLPVNWHHACSTVLPYHCDYRLFKPRMLSDLLDISVMDARINNHLSLQLYLDKERYTIERWFEMVGYEWNEHKESKSPLIKWEDISNDS